MKDVKRHYGAVSKKDKVVKTPYKVAYEKEKGGLVPIEAVYSTKVGRLTTAVSSAPTEARAETASAGYFKMTLSRSATGTRKRRKGRRRD